MSRATRCKLLRDRFSDKTAVFGMGLDLVGILAGVATLYVGTPLSPNPGFSIGGISPKSENILGNLFGLLGKPTGIDGTHNIIESDSSATRNDLYNTGNAHTMNLTLFQKMAEYADNDGFITMDDLADRAVQRFHESIATNPTFYYGPYTGTIARNAGYAFMGRFLSNHTKEFPLGGHLCTFTTYTTSICQYIHACILTTPQQKKSSPASLASTKKMVNRCTRKGMSVSRRTGIA